MGPRPGGPGPRGGMDPQGNTPTAPMKQKKIVTNASTFKVGGTLKDSVSGELMMFVNVALLNGTDSSFVQGTATDAQGYFEFASVPAGNYLLRASSIGYQYFFLTFEVTNNTSLGTLKMKPGAMTMREVKITTTRPLYAQDGEKMVYNVADDPSIQTGTTTDALQNAPGVEVDIEGNISLRGVSSVEIWVNDKPSRLTAENLKTYLETLPANALDRIETITNPSAKYATDAEAVINIITSAHIKKNHFLSFGANAASQPNVSPWISYTWANERLTVNAYLSGRFSQRFNESEQWSITRRDNPLYPGNLDMLDTVMYTQNKSTDSSKSWGTNMSLNISYEIDSTSDIDFWSHGSFSGNPSSSTNWISRDQRYIGGSLYEYDETNNRWGNGSFGMYGGGYTKKFNNMGHNLRVNLFGNFNTQDNFQQYDRIFSTTDSDPRNQSFYKFIDNNSFTFSEDLSVRYNRPYSKDGEMSYGLTYNRSDTKRNYRPYLLDTSYSELTILDDALFDALRRYTFADHNQSLGADVEWTRRWGGLTLELGLGTNYTHDHFVYDETTSPDDTTYNFISWRPSVHLSYRTEDMNNYKLNYSLRMSNPSQANLTRHISYSEDSYSVGNRNLHASYTHNAEAGWTKFFNFGYVGLEGYGRISTGEIDNLTDVTDDIDPIIGRIVNYSMPYNIGNSWRYGATANITYRPNGFFNLRLYANLYDYGYAMQYDKLGQDPIKENKWSYSIRLNAWAKVFNKYQIHASANYSSPTLGLMSVRSARYFVNCGIRADFFDRKMSAYINVQDIFNWGYKIGQTGSNTNPYFLSSSSTRNLNSRFISAGISFRFGKLELERNSTSGFEDNPSASE